MIKVGFIGAGSVAEIHMVGISRLKDVSVISIVKKNNDTIAKRSAELGVNGYHKNIMDMLNDSEIVAVHCLLPNNMHYGVIKTALKKGKHILAEKPHTITSQQSFSLTQFAKQTNLVCGINYRYRYYPAIQELRKNINNGSIGKIYMIQGTFFQGWLSNKKVATWRQTPKISGNSATLADIGSHILDLIQYITEQKIVRLIAHLKTIIPIRQSLHNKLEREHVMLDDYSSIIFETEKGIPGTITVSQVATGHGMSNINIEIIGSKKSVLWRREKPEELCYKSKDNKQMVVCVDHNTDLIWEHGICKLIESFYWDVKAHISCKNDEKRFKYPSFEDGYRGMRLLDAALKSHKTKKWVEVE